MEKEIIDYNWWILFYQILYLIGLIALIYMVYKIYKKLMSK